MADTATALVTGPVLLVEKRSGTTRPTSPDETPRAWAFTTVRVLVENLGVTEVTLGDRMPDPIEGELASYVVEVRPRNGGVNVRALREAV